MAQSPRVPCSNDGQPWQFTYNSGGNVTSGDDDGSLRKLV